MGEGEESLLHVAPLHLCGQISKGAPSQSCMVRRLTSNGTSRIMTCSGMLPGMPVGLPSASTGTTLTLFTFPSSTLTLSLPLSMPSMWVT